MLSEEQRRQKDLNILKATSEFINNPASMKEIAAKTGLTPSSVQRYLNDKRIIELLGQEVYDEIQNNLKILKQEAVKKGGIIFAKNNISIKDEQGKFNGSQKR